MKRAAKAIVSSVNGTSWFFGLVAGVLAVVMTVAVTYEVVLRYVFRSPTEFTLALTEYMLVACALLGAAYTLRQDGHVRVDLIINRLRPRARSILDIITSLVALSYCAVLTWQGWPYFWRCYQLNWRDDSPAMLPLAPVYFMLPLGAFLLCVQYLVKIYGYVSSLGGSGSERPTEKAG